MSVSLLDLSPRARRAATDAILASLRRKPAASDAPINDPEKAPADVARQQTE